MFDIAVIGGGVAAQMAANALKELGRVAISYKETNAADTFASFEFFEDPLRLFDSALVRSIYIATPVDTHLFYLIKALEAGIPALIEKPLLLDLAEVNKLANRSPTK